MNVNVVSFSLVSWNVRGLGDHDKCTLVRDSLCAARPIVVCLQESKLASIPHAKARSFLPSHHVDFLCVDASNTRGGLVTAWDARSLTLTSFIMRRHTLTTMFTCTASDCCFAVTNVYAPSDHRDSLEFLEDLEEVARQVSGCWTLAGDFNLTRSGEDNSNGHANPTLCDAFNNTIHTRSLIDIPLLDRLFTWSNHRSTPTLARLDRVLFNVPMSLTFPNSSLTSLPKTTSDHTPIQLVISTAIPKPNLFRFENAWLKHSDYLGSVLPAWHDTATTEAAGALVGKLKAVRRASKVWARCKRAPPSLHSNCKFVIYLFDVLEETRLLSAAELLLRRACQERLALAIRERAAYWKQRGKQRAIREGDSNTSFFHAHASQRLRRNGIRALEVNGVVVSSHRDKTTALTHHLRGLLGLQTATSTIDLASLYSASPSVSAVDAERLTARFTEAEAKAAVRAMNCTSSPGPDGFGPGFYTAAWPTVGMAVMELAWAFQEGRAELERLNRSYIVLIPKLAAAMKPSDYRPICLQNCSLKIVAKMLTSRLQQEIPRLIDPDQTGFLKGRSISENFIYAMELTQCCHRRKLPTLVLKLDFAKAFDSVNWECLRNVLEARGFPETWRE